MFERRDHVCLHSQDWSLVVVIIVNVYRRPGRFHEWKPSLAEAGGSTSRPDKLDWLIRLDRRSFVDEAKMRRVGHVHPSYRAIRRIPWVIY